MLSVPIIFEIPVWLKHAKLIRMISLQSALVWNILFFLFYKRAIGMIKKSAEEESDFVDVFEVLMIWYNIVLHGPIFLMNIAIIIKEIDYEI